MERTPFFKAFGPLLFGRKSRSGIEQIQRLNGLEDLYAIFGNLFEERLFWRAEKGVNSRTRSLPPAVTFWAFVSQALSPKSSCREVVRRIEAWDRWARRGSGVRVSAEAYCKARARLDLHTLHLVNEQIAWQCERNVGRKDKWLHGRPVKIVDGTTLSMPDTPENQALWPQPSSQKPGCGFPQLKLVGLFSLQTGVLLEEAIGDRHIHEARLFEGLWDRLDKGDVILEDRGFCSYLSLCSLQKRGVDTVARLHQARKCDWRTGRRLGPGDRLMIWSKPKQCPKDWRREDFEALPAELPVRIIRSVIEVEGFRTRTVTLATTLIDPVLYPADALRQLYGERWNVELHFAQIKTILGIDVLRCQSPAMIVREVKIHLIAYNLIRVLMQRAGSIHHVPLRRISFKGSLDTLRHWVAAIHASRKHPQKQAELVAQMLASLAQDPLPYRPERSEPRAKKRRPKNYQLLTKPIKQMGNLPHRNRSRKASPIRPKSALS